MLAMGMSRPGRTPRSADRPARNGRHGVVDYFRPLLDWLEKQNKGKQCGW